MQEEKKSIPAMNVKRRGDVSQHSRRKMEARRKRNEERYGKIDG